MPCDPTGPVPDHEAAAALAAIISRGAGGALTHETACFMATICAEYLVDQLEIAGYVVTRREELATKPGPLFGG